MPSLSSKTYYRVRDIPQSVWDALRSNARDANVILPTLTKAHAQEEAGHHQRGQVWITCSSGSVVEFVLAITQGYMGPYPAFVFTTLPFHALTDEHIRPRISMLAQALLQAVPRERIYSIFAVQPVASLFAKQWENVTGIQAYAEPYYAAKLSHCTSTSLDSRSASNDPALGYILRPGVQGDISAIADLCFMFADTAPPFGLSKEGAKTEAEILVRNKQVWVHMARNQGQPEEIASIVAYTRNSQTVGTITKVFTNPHWRRRGCAERLVRRVCKHMLTTEGKESVVLYVAHDNQAANYVYSRVGFAGLDRGERADGVEPWAEIGFDRNKVVLGHW